MIFGSPMGPPFGDKILENEGLECTPSPLRSQGGPKSAQGPKIDSKGVPKSMIFLRLLDRCFVDSMSTFVSQPTETVQKGKTR